MSLRLALPRGRLLAPVSGLLAAAGLPVGAVEDCGRDAGRVLPDGSSVLFIAESDVVVCVERDVADVGFVGREMLLERRPSVSELARLPLRPAHLVFRWFDDAGRRCAERCGRVRVATSYPSVAVAWLTAAGLQVEPVVVDETLDEAAARPLADAMLSLIEAGGRADATPPSATPPLGTVVAECDVCVIAGHAARALRPDAIAGLLERLRAAVRPAEVTA